MAGSALEMWPGWTRKDGFTWSTGKRSDYHRRREYLSARDRRGSV
jgi:hypothetical protein